MARLPELEWVCRECAAAQGGKVPDGHMPTWHIDRCGICEESKPVTEPRDFRPRSQQLSRAAKLQMQREDAARYRWLRDHCPTAWELRIWDGASWRNGYEGPGLNLLIDEIRSKNPIPGNVGK